MSSHPTPSHSTGSSDSGLDNIRAGVNQIVDWIKYAILALIAIGVAFYLYSGGAWWYTGAGGGNNVEGGGSCPGHKFSVTSAYGEAKIISRSPCQIRWFITGGSTVYFWGKDGRSTGSWTVGQEQVAMKGGDTYQLSGRPDEFLTVDIIQCPKRSPGFNMDSCN